MLADELRQPFADAVKGTQGRVDLARAALLIGKLEYPELDVPAYMQRLDEMGGALRQSFPENADTQTRIAGVCRYLFEEQGFRGNNQEYYDPRNSFLSDVLDRKIGIPITLSTVFMEVGQRAGLSTFGIGLPGHFIVRVEDTLGGILIDPFYGGELLSEQDCQRRVDRLSGGRLRLRPEHLAPCPRKKILARMLTNLKGIYVKSGDYTRALGVMQLLLVVSDSPELWRDRGLLYVALDCYALAAADLTRYLARLPGASDAEPMRRTLEEMQGKAARLN